MFLFVFKGSPARSAAFSGLLQSHASWLDGRLIERGDDLPSGARVTFYWIGAPAAPEPWIDAQPGRVTAALFAPPQHFEHGAGLDAPDTPIRFSYERTSGCCEITVPLVTPEQAYYATAAGEFAAGNDLRPLWRWTEGELDPTGVAALMQYGMTPPPRTVARHVQRVPSGYRLRCSASGELTVERHATTLAAGKQAVAGDERETRTLACIDAALQPTPPNAVCFFSGGTDSGLIAARLAGLGRTDVRLVNYAFGADDPESQHAEALARLLGMPFQRIVHDEGVIEASFDSIGRDAIFPFNDLSVIPTHRMLYAAIGELQASGAALLGVGADDVYDGGLKIQSWARVQRIPRPVRVLAAAGLGLTRPWWRDDRTRRWWGILTRSNAARHRLGAAIMHNDLAEIGYPYTGVQPRIEAIWSEIYDAFSRDTPIEDQMAFVYLLNGGMGWEAPKFDLLRRFGVRSLYPFVDGPMLRHGFSLDWEQKCEGTKDKQLLKRLLRSQLPAEMTQRPKVGFSPPHAQLLARSEIQQRVRAALLDSGAPLEPFLHRGFIERALDRTAAGWSPNRGVINLLWTAFFASSWVTQTRAALRVPDPR